MGRFIVVFLANMIAFMCAMTYGQWWNLNNQSMIVLLILPLVFTGFVCLARSLGKKCFPNSVNQHTLKIVLGMMWGQVIGISALWVIIGIAK